MSCLKTGGVGKVAYYYAVCVDKRNSVKKLQSGIMRLLETEYFNKSEYDMGIAVQFLQVGELHRATVKSSGVR